MSKQFRGAQKHRKPNPLWLDEMEETNQISNWKEELLGRINRRLSTALGEIKNVGHHIGAIQFQYDNPIERITEYLKLKIAWVTFNVWNPYTKEAGERTLRFGPDTAGLMVLVRSPKKTGDGEFDWYLLSRSKYQLAVQNHFVEISRGWDDGWFLLDRDFPGLHNKGKRAECVKSIRHIQMGAPILENTAEFMNDTSDHLIVVTLAKPMTKEELKEMLVRARIEKEYGENDNYPDLSILDGSDLLSKPMVFDLEEAAKHLNGHVTGKEDRTSMFGETFSVRVWTHFLSLYGKEFPDLQPQTTPLSELLNNS